jgi:hypothetical protein
VNHVSGGRASSAVALADGDDKPKIRLDESASGGLVARLDRLRQTDLVVGRQQRERRHLGQVPAEPIGFVIGTPLAVVRASARGTQSPNGPRRLAAAPAAPRWGSPSRSSVVRSNE